MIERRPDPANGRSRIVERVVFKLLIWAFFMLRVYLSLKSWGMLE